MNMRRSKNPLKNSKGIAVAVVVCFMAAMAIVGTYTLTNYRDGVRNQLVQVEEETRAEETRQPQERDNSTNVNNAVNDRRTDRNTNQDRAERDNQSEVADEVTPVAGNPAHINFSEEDQLLWPVTGSILMNFSMDETVFFSTLNQYRLNPALIIAGRVDDKVIAAASGVVTSIEVSAQTGKTITLDMGNGYEAIYGQLKGVSLQVGDVVEAGHLIGHLSEPTKFFSVEGTNLFFKMLRNGEPVNPLEYLAS